MPTKKKTTARRAAKQDPIHSAEGRLAAAVERNIATLAEIRRQMETRRTIQDRFADVITNFSGSTLFLYLHIVWFGVWIGLNTGVLQAFGIEAFDPFPFGLLTMIVSLEAIFLSTFVLISQQRLSEIQDDRADLDLQIDLLAEYEMTKVLTIVDAIAHKLGLHEGRDPELAELEIEINPERVLREISERKRKLAAKK
ncbi:MAG: DUF1003 domain-containing protein [Candidatus Peribacteraceae bacterium]|nr:DUF1003 domain-containing protein [Candidatus Peribacteraceae bacterium]